MDIAALIIAIVSALFTGGSLWYTRGQKEAADESAESAKTVARIEQQREHRENRPEVKLEFGKWISEPNMAFLNAENLSGEPVDVVVELVGGHRLAGFGDEPDQRATTYTFENLRPGVPGTAAFKSVDTSAWTKATVRFLVTPRRGADMWGGELVSVKLPRRAAKVHFVQRG